MTTQLSIEDLATPKIPIKDITSPGNLRVDVGDVSELAASIGSIGLLEPVVVTPNGSGFHLLAGHRRIAAVKSLHWKEVPAHILAVADGDAEVARLTVQLIENLHRVDLSPVEEASGYAQLKAFGLKQAEIARKVGRSETHVSKRLSILELPDRALDMYQAGQIGTESLYELTKVIDVAGDVGQVLDTLNVKGDTSTTFKVDEVQRLVKDATVRAGLAKDIAARRAQLEAAAVTVLDVAGYDQWGTPKLPKDRISYGGVLGYLDVDKHAKEPCHAVCVYGQYSTVYESAHCTDKRRHQPEGASKLKLPDPSKSTTQASWQVEHDQKVARSEVRTAVLKSAARAILSGRPPARDKILDRHIATWMKFVDDQLGADVIEILDLYPEVGDETVISIAEIYEQADGSNRTRIMAAAVLAEVIEQAAWIGLDENGSDFLSFLEFCAELGHPIDLDGAGKETTEA
ncbi:MAG TPA: ParB/RepB/Spo0J family partition protein [Acidimicrobiia bacterium]|nr:ParB/RepB/Spo0J family partition protein [Acidimicrobiia bacterium]